MRVAHFTDTYLPRRDGVITSIRTLAGALTELGHPSLTVVPRHPDQDPDGLLRLGAVPLGVADLRMSRWVLRGAAADKATAALARWEPDVIHVHTPGPTGLLGVLAARRLGVPLVQTYHTDLHAYADAYHFPARAIQAGLRLYARRLGVTRPPARPGDCRRRAAVDVANTLLLGDADAVVVPTRAVLDRISLPVPADRVTLVPTGVATAPTTAADVSAFRARHRLADTDRVVLFVGRVNREKGVDLLLPAFARVLASCPRARLVLVGALYDERWFHGLLRAVPAAVAERVVWTGQLPPGEVAAGYGAAAAFAFPSRTDTQALVLQEAALAGLPSVIVDPVLHRHGPLGGSAILTAPEPQAFADGVLGLLADPGAARRLGAEAAARASRHTPGRYGEAMLAVYRRAQSGFRQRRAAPVPAPGGPELVPVP